MNLTSKISLTKVNKSVYHTPLNDILSKIISFYDDSDETCKKIQRNIETPIESILVEFIIEIETNNENFISSLNNLNFQNKQKILNELKPLT